MCVGGEGSCGLWGGGVEGDGYPDPIRRFHIPATPCLPCMSLQSPVPSQNLCNETVTFNFPEFSELQ